MNNATRAAQRAAPRAAPTPISMLTLARAAPARAHRVALRLTSAFSSTAAKSNPWDCTAVRKAWDFERNGGAFDFRALTHDNNNTKDGNAFTTTSSARTSAKAFFDAHGFVVLTNLMSESENTAAVAALVSDLHEVNPSTSHITDPALFPEEALPTSPNRTFRTTCNMAFGRFSWFVRGHAGVRDAFVMLHGMDSEERGGSGMNTEAAKGLACSWDNPFYTPAGGTELLAGGGCTELHWDHNWYYAGEKAPMADELCVQGVYYARPTDYTTPTFICVPKSMRAWRDVFSESRHNPSKHGARVLNYLPLSEFEGKEENDRDGEEVVPASGLGRPVRIHVPARGLLLWNSRTCHGNTAAVAAPPLEESSSGGGGGGAGGGGGGGRVAFAICYGPVEHRTAAVQKEALLKGLSGIRTTHHPGIMLAHDQHGYPEGFVGEGKRKTRRRRMREEEEAGGKRSRPLCSVQSRVGTDLRTHPIVCMFEYVREKGPTPYVMR